jgi:hypothetical protein
MRTEPETFTTRRRGGNSGCPRADRLGPMTAGRRALVLLVAGAAGLGDLSCRRERTGGAAPTSGAPAAVAPRRPRFQPPANRLLTDRHLDVYVKVRRAAHDRSEADAARALGIDSDEFAWVRARVVEALVALDEAHVRQQASETYARTIASLRQTLKSVRDPETALAVEAQIAGLERERTGMQASDPLPAEVAANARKVAGRRAELEAALK